MSISSFKSKHAAIFVFLISGLLLAGCGGPPAPGSDNPVLKDQLSGVKLTSVNDGITWTFTDTDVVIECGGKKIPADLINDVLKDAMGALAGTKKIKATWTLDEGISVLSLTGISIDDKSSTKEAKIAAKNGGGGQIKIGNRSYNPG